MRTLVRCGAVLAAALVFEACGASDRAEDITPETPSGTFAGQPWTMRSASVEKDGTELKVRLFAVEAAPCAIFPPQGSTEGYIIWSMPAQLGKRPLKLSLSDFDSPENQTITFVTPPSNNTISTDGIIHVTDLTDTSVTFGFIAESGLKFGVNGTVTATLCE